MVRDFRQEARDLLTQAERDCEQTDMNSVFDDAAVLLGKELKAMHGRSRDFELMLIRVVRHIGRAKSVADLGKVTQQASDLIARLGCDGVLR